jgi:chromosome segregation ATPase
MPPSDAFRGLDDLALSAYLDRLFHGRRVLWLGDAASGAPDRAARVAASVLVADPNFVGDRIERRNLRVVHLADGAPLPGGPHDVIVVGDLADIGLATDVRVRQLAATLAPGGVLVVASSNGDAPVRFGRSPTDPALSYEALYQLLAQVFPAVRMLGQAPFVGFTVADFSADGDPSVVFDGSLLGDASETPERFVALCGAAEVVLDAYAVVQLPAHAALAVGRASPVGPSSVDAAAAEARATALSAELRAAREQVDAGNVHAEELEATLALRTGALAELDGELERLRLELGAARDESETRVAALRIARDELEKLRATPAAPPADHARLEELLHERAREIRSRDEELARRATLFRDLVEELSALREHRLIDETSAAADAERRGHEAAQRVTALEAQVLSARSERERAVQRALQAEAERTEAAFRVDEALGRLAEISERSGRADEERARREAELSGFVRGLRARAAELEELRGQAEARLAMERLEVDEKSNQIKDLQRSVEELRDQLELQIVRASSAGQQSAGAGHVGAFDELRAERDGLRARLEDREAALAARAAAPSGDPTLLTRFEEASARATSLAARFEESAAHASSLTARLAIAEAATESERQRVTDLTARVAERESALRAREGDVETGLRALQSSAARVTDLEAESRRLTAALDEARACLVSLGASLETAGRDGTRATLSGTLDAPLDAVGDATELASLRQQLEGLQYELRDRELLLRSLSEQLRERDERLRAWPVRPSAEAGSSAESRAESQRLEAELRARESELAQAQVRARTADRELTSARDAVAASRTGLEELLSGATMRGDASTADRIGALLRALSRV